MSVATDMVAKLQEHLSRCNLIPSSASVLVAYSGGADSTALLHLLKELGCDLVAAHLHHGQREEADKEMRLCEAFCQELGVPFVGGRADVPRMSRELKIGLEEAGREARYNFLHNAAFRTQCTLIATAHTKSDLVETVLLNLTRGSGLSGLAGIPERRENIVRPMLIFSREETRAYCDELGLWYHDDPANVDISFSRARLRHRVLKELQAINPAAEDAIARLAAIAGEEDRFLNGAAAAALELAEVPLNGALRFLTLDCEAAFDMDKLLSLPLVLLRRAVRLTAEAVGGRLDFHQTEAIVHGLGSPFGDAVSQGAITSEDGAAIMEWDGVTVHVRSGKVDEPFRHPLTVPGETVSDEFGWTISAMPASSAGPQQRADLTALLDASKVKGQLYFRSPQQGDEMQPLGFTGHRKLSDLLSEAKLTKAARARLPIICDIVGPVWAPGVCLSEGVAANAQTGNVMLLRFGPNSGAQSPAL